MEQTRRRPVLSGNDLAAMMMVAVAVVFLALALVVVFPTRWVPGAVDLAQPYAGKTIGRLLLDGIADDTDNYRQNYPELYRHVRAVQRHIWLRYALVWTPVLLLGWAAAYAAPRRR